MQNKNPYKKQLLSKIKNKTAVLGVIGLGYVGLPLAVEKAKAGYKTIGFDMQEKKVRWVNEGRNYIGDIIDSDLKEVADNGLLQATTDYSFIEGIDTVCVCVPTPLDIYQQPDLSYVKTSTENIAKYLHPGMLIVLESTTYPGTTEEIVKPILEKISGLKCGQDFFLAFSPERIDPGNPWYKVRNTPKVVGGVTPDCTEVASYLYRSIIQGKVHPVSSSKVAEMEKIYENVFRYTNIALANEMSILCHKMGIDIWEVIEAAKTKPFGFQAFYPGPGIGGHCIPIDPFYLTWKAREYDFHPRFIELSGEINEYMPYYVVERVGKALNSIGKAISRSKILVIGIAYKPNVNDLRESAGVKIITLLQGEGAYVAYHDPLIPEIPSIRRYELKMKSVQLSEEEVKKYDLVLIATNHSNIDYELILQNAKLIVDTRNVYKSSCNSPKIWKA